MPLFNTLLLTTGHQLPTLDNVSPRRRHSNLSRQPDLRRARPTCHAILQCATTQFHPIPATNTKPVGAQINLHFSFTNIGPSLTDIPLPQELLRHPLYGISMVHDHFGYVISLLACCQQPPHEVSFLTRKEGLPRCP